MRMEQTIMTKYIFLLIFLVSGLLYAENIEEEQTLSPIEQQNQKNMNIKDRISGTQEYRTYKEATNSENIKEWTTKDFQQNQGGNTGMIGSTQIFLGANPGGDTALNGNPNEMTTGGIQENEQFNDIDSLNVWTNEMQDEIVSGALTSSNTIITKGGTVKCYITRNIPIRYKCSYTQLSYGEGMGENGVKARTQCENECYEQFGCVSLIANPIVQTTNVESLSIYSVVKDENGANTPEEEIIKEDTVEKVLNSTTKLNKITFKVVGNNKRGANAYLDILYTNKKGLNQFLVSKLLVEEGAELSLTVNDIATKITMKLYTKDDEVERRIENIQLIYGSNQKFICPKMQDISNRNPGAFAHLCPSGKVIEFSTSTTDYKICADYGIVGDNKDGTFSSEDACFSVCRENHGCGLDITTFNTEVLKEFQEGCIEGQENCETNTCKNLRLNGNRILNENVFRAGEYPTHTIINSTQQTGVKRPRPLLDEDMDYLKRNNEEWKDEAYKYMLDNNRFAQSVVSLDQNTEMSIAYNIGQKAGSNYGYSSTGSRALYATLKPKAYDVHNNTSYKFYIVIDAIIEKYITNESARQEKSKDRILYLRTTDTEDSFKPFAIKRNFGKNVIVTNENGETFQNHSENEEATWTFESFNGTQWHYHSSSNVAETYKNEKIVLGDRPYLRVQSIDNLNNIIYSLPGIVRSITRNGLYETKNYSGNYDGTGEALARFNVYVHYTNQNLTYNDFLEMIENEEIKPFYDNLTPSAFPKEVLGDNMQIGADINIYQYGPINKKSAYVRIFPKQTEVGKKGFIYVFGY